jgi:hypothetical protein
MVKIPVFRNYRLYFLSLRIKNAVPTGIISVDVAQYKTGRFYSRRCFL